MSVSTTLKILVFSIITVGVAVLALGLGEEALDYMTRARLFSELQPVQLKNCEMKRYGLGRDEGYLLCDNLLKNTKVVYSYGIAGRDGLGCEISTKLKVPVHEYDCFDLTRPLCDKGNAIFHEECVGGITETDKDGRLFDTVQHQIAKNHDAGKTLLLKMDVEGAEWESLAAMPDEALRNVVELAMEFHQYKDRLSYVDLIKKLKKTFYVAHIHFNNHACTRGVQYPFPSYAFQVLLVNKSVGILNEGKRPVLPNPLDEKDDPNLPDCQNLDQESRYQILKRFVNKIATRIRKMPRKLLGYFT